MKKYILVTLAVIGLATISCNNDKQDDYDGSNVNDGLIADVIEGDDDRIEDLTENNSERKKNNVKGDGESTILPVKTVWTKMDKQIRSDINNSESQQANGLLFDEDNMILYISYGTKGESYDGFIDVISISESDTPGCLDPKILQSIHVANIDLYALALDKTNKKLYVSAGADTDPLNNDSYAENDIHSGGAVLVFETGDLNNTEATSISYDLIDVPGYVAKDITLNGNKIIVISGTNGYITQYNISDYSLAENTPVGDGRAVGIAEDKIYWLAGNQLNLIGGGSISVAMDDKEGAQRLINFYKGYPIVALGSNGVGVYSKDLNTAYHTIPTVKNNYSLENTNEEVNDVTPFLDNELLATAEGTNGVMFKYIKDGDITGAEHIINAGGIRFDGSPNAIISYKNSIMVASGTSGTTFVSTGYFGRYNDDSYADFIPTYKIELDQTSKRHNIPTGLYKGTISGKGHTFIVENSDIVFAGEIYADSLLFKNSSYNINSYIGNGKTIWTQGEIGHLIITDSSAPGYGMDFGLNNKILGDIRITNSTLNTTNFGNPYGNVYVYGSDVSASYFKTFDSQGEGSLIIQKDDAGKASHFAFHTISATVQGDSSIIGKDCSVSWDLDNSDLSFNQLELKSGAWLGPKDSGDTMATYEGGQNTTITVKDTLKAQAKWTIKAVASDNLKIKVGKFSGYTPQIVDKDGNESDAKWNEILEESGV